MHPFVRDVCLAAGTILASVGAGYQWGAPVGCMVGGGLILGLTILTGGR